MPLKIIKVKNSKDLDYCIYIRKQVFYDEEHAPETLYIRDEKDEDVNTLNLLGMVNNIPIATTRLIKIDNDKCKIQRMSVINKYRGNGYAKELLFFLENCAKEYNYKIIEADSALKAVGFYEKYRYKKISDIFHEDNRPHIKLNKILR